MLNIIGASLIFVSCFIFFVMGHPHRTIVAMLGAVLMVLFGSWRGFYDHQAAYLAIDYNTIGLLFGMMIIVGILRGTGFFRYLAIKGAKLAGGDPWKLLLILGLTTAFVSMLIDNVTTILLIAPVTILVSDILKINPRPLLLGEVLLSNLGGVGTLVGDPPNIMIGSASGFSFNSFIIHLMPVVLLAMGIALLLFKVIYRKDLHSTSRRVEQIIEMDESRVIKDKPTLFKCILALITVVVLFLLEEKLGLKSSFIALLGAVFTLIMVQPDVKKIFGEIEWPVLIFFASLFIMVGGVDKSGILRLLGTGLGSLSSHPLEMSLLLIWISVVFSSLAGNIPYTAAMIPVVGHIAAGGFNPNPLWWGLALGAGFGANGTPISSAAGVLIVEMSDKTRSPITFRNWFKSGTITTVVSAVLASLVFIFFFSWFN